MARDIETNITANDKTGSGINSAVKNFNKLEENTKKITKKIGELPLGAIGGQLGTDLAQGLAKGLAPVATYALPILGAIGIGAAPLIGASISGAIIGGAGLGGVIGGLIIASKDARVQAAAKGIGDSLKIRLSAAGGAFVQPAIEGINTIKKSIDTVDLEGIFKNSARFVQPLAEGIGTAIESLGDGLESLIQNAGPSIDAIADGIAGIGQAVGTGLSSLADNGEGAADALRVLFAIINSSASSVFQLVNVLTELYEINRAIGGDILLRTALKAMGQDLDGVGENGRKAGSGTFAAAGGIQKAGDAAGNAVPQLKSVAEQMQDAADAARGLYDAQTTTAEALARASKAARENGETLSLNSEKGRENRTAVSNLAGAINRQYAEFVKVNGEGAAASALAVRLRGSFIKAAEGFGIGAGKARELANRILGIPQKRDARINVNSAQAKQNALDVRDAINSVQSRTVTLTVRTRYRGDGNNENSPSIGGGGGRTFSLNSGGATFAANSAVARTGGPTPVVAPNVENKITVFVGDQKVRAIVKDEIRNEQFRSQGRRY